MKNLKTSYITGLLLATAAFSSCGPSKSEKASQQQEEKQQSAIENPTVETIVLKKGKLASTLQVPGELQAFQEVSLYAKINSFVKKYLVDIGSEVHKNQLMAILEAPEINSQLAAAKSHIKQQEAIYLASKANYDRLYNTSKTPGTIAQNDLDQAQARMKSDYANVEAAKADYQQVAANLAYLEIRAPFDGVVSQRNVNLGTYVSAAGAGANTPLFVVQEQRKLRLVVSIPEINTGGLKDQQTVTFSVRALPTEKFTAHINRLAGALDNRLRSERLEMDVNNPDRKLLPGMYAEVDVPMQSRDSTFVIPKTALVQSTEKVFIIRATSNHHAEWVDVQKGLQSKDVVEVYSKDLNPGDVIIKTATDEIRDGQTITPKAPEDMKIISKGAETPGEGGEKKLGQESSGEQAGSQSGNEGQSGTSGKKGKGGKSGGSGQKKEYGNGGRGGN